MESIQHGRQQWRSYEGRGSRRLPFRPDRARSADRLSRFQRAASDKDTQPAKQRLLRRVEQVVAPRNCLAQRLLAGR